MTRLDPIPPSLTYPSAPHFDPSTGSGHRRGHVRRLIVLFPADTGYGPTLTHQIWEIASTSGLNVLFLSLCNDPREETQLRLRLVTLAAVIKDSNVSTEIQIERGNDWVRQARDVWKPGDVIACHAGQRVGLTRKSLHEVLQSQLGAPIHILADEQPVKNTSSNLFQQTAFWLGSLAIIGGFLWFQVKLVQLPQDWAQNLLLYLSVFAEVGLLLLWNSIFA